MNMPLPSEELDLLQSLVDLHQHPQIIELGCDAAQMSHKLLARYSACEITGLEVDERQHARNLLNPMQRLHFIKAAAQAILFEKERFDLALMLKFPRRNTQTFRRRTMCLTSNVDRSLCSVASIRTRAEFLQ